MRIICSQHFWNLTQRLPSSTCKRLAEISAPTFFRSVCLKEFNTHRHRRLAENAQYLGGLVRHLKLILKDGLVDNNDLPICELLSSMKNVRSLTIVHRRHDVAKHTPLQQAVEKLVRLEEVTIQEKDYNPNDFYSSTLRVAITETFFHIFLSRVLGVHGRHLRELHLYTPLPLHPLLYIDLRDKTPNLRSITFTSNIGTDMEDVFAEPIPWASGQLGRLESLTFQRCTGTHADRLVQNILQGVYGRHLKDVQFICSGKYLVHIPEPPPFQVFTSLERLHFDHINLQELSTIALLPIQELSLTRIAHNAFCELPLLLEGGLSSFGGMQPGFRGLKKLRLNPKFAHEMPQERFPAECKAAYKELRERSLPQRDIQLSLDAVVTPINCVCNIHE